MLKTSVKTEPNVSVLQDSFNCTQDCNLNRKTGFTAIDDGTEATDIVTRMETEDGQTGEQMILKVPIQDAELLLILIEKGVEQQREQNLSHRPMLDL